MTTGSETVADIQRQLTECIAELDGIPEKRNKHRKDERDLATKTANVTDPDELRIVGEGAVLIHADIARLNARAVKLRKLRRTLEREKLGLLREAAEQPLIEEMEKAPVT